MKTPWRFVADLVSRKPKADVTGEHRLDTTETRALEYRPGIEETVEHGEAASPELPVYVGQQEETETQISTPDLIPASVVETEQADNASAQTSLSVAIDNTVSTLKAVERKNVAPAAEKDEAFTAAAPEKTKTPKKPRPAVSNEAADSRVEAAASVPADKPKTIVEEMATLDAEVDVLRRQLSKKLTEQNAQLRRMLARFETR